MQTTRTIDAMRSDDSVTSLCNAVMKAVVDTMGAKLKVRHAGMASDVMKAEIKAALNVTDTVDEEYKMTRDAVVIGSVHPSIFTAMIVARCILKIQSTLTQENQDAKHTAQN